jgi:hypothetical protein
MIRREKHFSPPLKYLIKVVSAHCPLQKSFKVEKTVIQLCYVGRLEERGGRSITDQSKFSELNLFFLSHFFSA